MAIETKGSYIIRTFSCGTLFAVKVVRGGKGRNPGKVSRPMFVNRPIIYFVTIIPNFGRNTIFKPELFYYLDYNFVVTHQKNQ